MTTEPQLNDFVTLMGARKLTLSKIKTHKTVYQIFAKENTVYILLILQNKHQIYLFIS